MGNIKYSSEVIKAAYEFFVEKCLELSGFERNVFLDSRLREATKWRFAIWTILKTEYRCSYEHIAALVKKNYSSIRWGVLVTRDALEYPNSNPSYAQAYKILLNVGSEYLSLTKSVNPKQEFIHTTYEAIEKWLDDNRVDENVKFRLLTSLNDIKY